MLAMLPDNKQVLNLQLVQGEKTCSKILWEILGQLTLVGEMRVSTPADCVVVAASEEVVLPTVLY